MIVKLVILQRKVYSFEPSDPILIIVFFYPFKFACERNHKDREAARYVLLSSSVDTLISALCNFISAATKFTSVFAYLQTARLLTQNEIPQLYLKVVNHLLETFASGKTAPKIKCAICPHKSSASLTWLYYAGNLYTESNTVANDYERSSFNEITVEGVAISKQRNSNHFWTRTRWPSTLKTF